MIARPLQPIVDAETRFFAAYLVQERVLDYLRQRAALRARWEDGEWSHFIESTGAIRSERAPRR